MGTQSKIMIHPKAGDFSVLVSAGQVENMQRRGWKVKPADPKKPATRGKQNGKS